jgi:hypothetical protein
MTIEEQDAILGRLVREKNGFKKELAILKEAVQPYAELLSRLSGEIIHDPNGALQTLNGLDVAKLKELLADHAQLSARLHQHARKIADMGCGDL